MYLSKCGLFHQGSSATPRDSPDQCDMVGEEYDPLVTHKVAPNVWHTGGRGFQGGRSSFQGRGYGYSRGSSQVPPPDWTVGRHPSTAGRNYGMQMPYFPPGYSERNPYMQYQSSKSHAVVFTYFPLSLKVDAMKHLYYDVILYRYVPI